MSAILRARTLAVLPLMLVAVLVASMFAFTPSADAATRGKRVMHALEVVRNQKGDPYQYGAAGPRRFDCSGYTMYVYRKAVGRKLPHKANSQQRYGKAISKNKKQLGDLIIVLYL